MKRLFLVLYITQFFLNIRAYSDLVQSYNKRITIGFRASTSTQTPSSVDKRGLNGESR